MLLIHRSIQFRGIRQKNMGSPYALIYRFKCFQASSGTRIQYEFKKKSVGHVSVSGIHSKMESYISSFFFNDMLLQDHVK